jgi:hypothetical protein
MAFNLFGPPTKDDIRVGYIDPNLGFVEGVTICEANEYALKNPGTTFVFRNGNNVIQYLNVNEVNQLDPNILTSTDDCGGINQRKECGPPVIQLFGGGGVGAAGNPVIGKDRSLLAVDVVRQGNGYQYPPIVAARDNCNYGSGVTLTAVLGEVAETIETYDNEADFEDYEICEDSEVGYGKRYGPDGEDLGPWEPRLYTDPGQDPIRNEVIQFQEIVRKLARAPFFSTRKNKPTKIICSDPRVIPSKYDVTDKTHLDYRRSVGEKDPIAWNEFMNSYAISPVSASNVRGSDFAGKVFTFEWTEDFPTDGEYIFRGLCDNSAQLYVDNLKIADLAAFNAPVRPIQKTFKKGIHNIRVDLLNVPFTETITKPSITPPAPSSDICISVIDEASPSSRSQQADWDLFRKNYPQRKFYLLDPGGRGGFKRKIPAGFSSNNNAFGPITVNRDDGDTSRISDWFSICGLKSAPVGTVVSLAIDTSGSMREKTVRASYASFKQKCRAAGIVLVDTTFKNERFISPHNKPLPSGPTSAPPVAALPPTTETIISSKSWNENPMGVAITIDAPEPSIPQEPAPVQEGRCPPNPIWSTRFPGAKETWYPVRYIGEKIERTIETPPPPEKQVQETQQVEFNIFGQGGKLISGYSFTFTAVDGQHTFTLNNVQKSKETRVEKIPIRKNVNYVVVASHKDNRKLEQGIIKQGTKKREGGIGESNKIFADGVKTANDNDDIQVTTNFGKFISSNKTKVSGRSTFELTYVLEGSAASTSAGITNSPTKTIITTDGWSKFFNRYAISPIPPLDIPGSDGGGVLFTNSWELDIPYDGFYKFAVQRDNTARLYVDGNLAFDVTTAGDDIWRDFRNKPKFQKVFITKGRHTIGIELQNESTETFSQVPQKIFRTKDWQTSAKPVASIVDVDFTVKTVKSSRFASTFRIADLGISVSKPAKTLINQTIPKKVEVGKVYTIEIEVPQSKNVTLKVRGNTLEVEDLRSSTARDLFVTISRGGFFDVVNGRTKATCKFVVESGGEVNLTGLTGGTAKDGVTYEGPPLFTYKDPKWGEFMNNNSVSPLLPPLDAENPEINGVKKYTWKGVKFPESGQYDITFLADNNAKLIIGGKEVLSSQGFAENPQTFKVNISQGTYAVVVECDNIPDRTNIFRNNPTGFGLIIRKNVSVRSDFGKSWKENPIGIGAILIPPPCPRKISGRGVVTDIIVNDPGNGYLPPAPQLPGYPVALRLKQVVVENTGINYSGNEEFPILNGAVLQPVFGPFGTVEEVKVLNPGLGFTEYPNLRLISETGVNASFRPVFEVVRDPIVLPEKLIQVTDLVGLKQTGYVDGRAYYGAVYYEDGVRYAGFYETVGDLVQVYDTLQESIAARVTTPASAIERSGTDIRSNDPRLNIPGTPQNLI